MKTKKQMKAELWELVAGKPDGMIAVGITIDRIGRDYVYLSSIREGVDDWRQPIKEVWEQYLGDGVDRRRWVW